jgi:hypothetical protein
MFIQVSIARFCFSLLKTLPSDSLTSLRHTQAFGSYSASVKLRQSFEVLPSLQRQGDERVTMNEVLGVHWRMSMRLTFRLFCYARREREKLPAVKTAFNQTG